jgi:hypothetical protein
MAADRQPRVAGNKENRMKTLAVMVFVVGVSACAAMPDVETAGTGPAVVDLSSREQLIGDWVVEGKEPAAAGGFVTPRSAIGPTSCVVVQYCDAPGPDGTRCVQTGCSVQDALTECTIEAPRECYRVVCPFVFVGPGGKRFQNGSCF